MGDAAERKLDQLSLSLAYESQRYLQELVRKCDQCKMKMQAVRKKKETDLKIIEGQIIDLRETVQENKSLLSSNSDLVKLEKELRDLERIKNELLEEQETVVRQLRDVQDFIMKKKPSVSEKDKFILDKCKKKLKLYKQTTGIRWDYSCEKQLIQGYILNEKSSCVKSFSFSCNSDIEDLLWGQMSAAASHDWFDIQEA